MISWIGATFLVVCFIILMQRLGMIKNSHKVVTIARNSLSVIKSSELSDEDKEQVLQKEAGRLLWLFLVLAGSGAAALLIPLLILWLGDQLEIISLQPIFTTLMSPLFIGVSTVLTILILWNPFKKRK